MKKQINAIQNSILALAIQRKKKNASPSSLALGQTWRMHFAITVPTGVSLNGTCKRDQAGFD